MSSNIRLTYRPEIDGLKALSIIFVLLYHAKFEIFNETLSRSGFIGVDIFFVLSGYLITSLITKELTTTGGFSFFNFYERRARRILPALLVSLFAFVPVAWLLLLPSSITSFSKTILFTLIASSNYYFYGQQSDYFNSDDNLNPFLHTWSLSIEEQFYILFPLIFVNLYKLSKKHIPWLLLAILGVNLALVQLLGSKLFHSKAFVVEDVSTPFMFLSSFYIPTSRVWEFLAGAILGYLEISRKGTRSTNPYLNQLCPLIGLILIGWYTTHFDDVLFHPSVQTFMMPVLGTSLLIWYLNKGGVITAVLSNPVLVEIGKLSYSLYLYHYPLLVFFKNFSQAKDHQSLAIYLTMLLSVVSYKFVEAPFRNKTVTSLAFVSIFLVSIYSALALTNLAIVYNNGMASRFQYITSDLNFQIDNKFYTDDWARRNNETSNFRFVAGNTQKKVVVIGNSHGFDLYTMFEQNKGLFEDFEFAYIRTAYIDSVLELFKSFNECGPHQSLISADLDTYNFCIADYLLVSPRWDGVNEDKLQQLLSLSVNARKKLILVSNIPHFAFNGQSTLVDQFVLTHRRLPHGLEVKLLKEAYYDSYVTNQWVQSVNNQLRGFSRMSNTIFLDKSTLLCDQFSKTCEFFTPNDIKITFDGAHLTEEGAKYLGKMIYEKNWLKLD